MVDEIVAKVKVRKLRMVHQYRLKSTAPKGCKKLATARSKITKVCMQATQRRLSPYLRLITYGISSRICSLFSRLNNVTLRSLKSNSVLFNVCHIFGCIPRKLQATTQPRRKIDFSLEYYNFRYYSYI